MNYLNSTIKYYTCARPEYKLNNLNTIIYVRYNTLSSLLMALWKSEAIKCTENCRYINWKTNQENRIITIKATAASCSNLIVLQGKSCGVIHNPKMMFNLIFKSRTR